MIDILHEHHCSFITVWIFYMIFFIRKCSINKKAKNQILSITINNDQLAIEGFLHRYTKFV